MKIIIHRGTHEIGGSCVEIRTDQSKILLDVGMPLDFDSRTQEEQVQIRHEARTWADGADAIFISHYHADHHGLLPDVGADVDVYATLGTAMLIRASVAMSGRGGGDYLERLKILPKVDDDRGFESVMIGDIRVTPYTVDHAAYDACAFLVEADGRRVLYSGDIRRHGVKRWLYHILPTKVDCMLLEGTNLSSDKDCRSEREICAQFMEQFMADADKLHYVWCSGQNIDRIVQIFNAAGKCSRKLIVDTYVAYILEKVHRTRSSIPSPLTQAEGAGVFRYFKNRHYIDQLEKSGQDADIVESLKTLPTVDVHDIGQNPGRYVWIIRPSMLDVMSKYNNTPSVVITSIWEGYEEKEQKFMAWIRERGFANPHIHTSGHADATSLQKIVRHINPGMLIPIHTEAPQRYAELFPDMAVRCLQDGEAMDL